MSDTSFPFIVINVLAIALTSFAAGVSQSVLAIFLHLIIAAANVFIVISYIMENIPIN